MSNQINFPPGFGLKDLVIKPPWRRESEPSDNWQEESFLELEAAVGNGCLP
jgi:hypothetical protein